MRFQFLTRLRRDERGASLVLVAISLLVLLGFAALAIDGGLAFLDVRGSTNAADSAAMAAALQECSPDTSGDTPEEKALAVAAENGYSDGVIHSAEDGVHTVVITTASGGALGPATNVAPDSIEVVARSAAACTGSQFLDGYAVFGESSSCGPIEVNLSGSSGEIDGGVHSNDRLKIVGSSHDVNGAITWLGDCNGCGSLGGDNTQIRLDPPVLPYPEPAGSLVLGHFTSLPSGVRDLSIDPIASQPQITGTYRFENYGSADVGLSDLQDRELATGDVIDTSAVVITTGDIALPPGTTVASGAGVTLIAGGQIDFKSGSYVGYLGRDDGFGPGLLAFANGDGSAGCSSKDIKTAAAGITYSGILFAPFGEIDISTADSSVNEGSLIGYRVTISAASSTISYTAGSDGPSGFQLDLLGTD